MNTKVYGSSDDLIEIDGPLNLELNLPHGDQVALSFSDGTLVQMSYGHPMNPAYEGMWHLSAVKQGEAYIGRTPAESADSKNYSDVIELGPDIAFVVVIGKDTSIMYTAKEQA